MKILILGDVHGDIKIVETLIEKECPDFVLQVGDLSSYSEFKKPVYFIAGNHEDQDLLEKMDTNRIKFNNLYHIKNGETIILKKGIEIITVLGLGGNFGPTRFKLPKSKLEGDRRRHFVEEEINKSLSAGKVDVFLTHEAPYSLSIVKRNRNVGVEIIDEVIKKIKPFFVFSGHHHVFKEAIIDNVNLISLDRPNKSYYILNKDDNKFNLVKKEALII